MSDFDEYSRMNTTLNKEYNNAFLQYQGIINFAAGKLFSMVPRNLPCKTMKKLL